MNVIVESSILAHERFMELAKDLVRRPALCGPCMWCIQGTSHSRWLGVPMEICFSFIPFRVVINNFTVKLVDPIVGHIVSTMN
jgi:hypothetical protein